MEGRANFIENNELVEEKEGTVLSWALSLVLLTGCLMLLGGQEQNNTRGREWIEKCIRSISRFDNESQMAESIKA